MIGPILALTAAIMPTASARPVAATTPALHGPAVVVLWASWCASCQAEVARLPHLARVAAPLPIVTIAIDPVDRARALLVKRGEPTANAYADDRAPRAVLDDWGGVGSALPIAVAIDRNGQVCGRKLGLLGTDQLREWAARCSK